MSDYEKFPQLQKKTYKTFKLLNLFPAEFFLSSSLSPPPTPQLSIPLSFHWLYLNGPQLKARDDACLCISAWWHKWQDCGEHQNQQSREEPAVAEFPQLVEEGGQQQICSPSTLDGSVFLPSSGKKSTAYKHFTLLKIVKPNKTWTPCVQIGYNTWVVTRKLSWAIGLQRGRSCPNLIPVVTHWMVSLVR